jgi:hypothetical protein
VRTPYSTPGCNAGYCGNGDYLVHEYTKDGVRGEDGLLLGVGGREE